MSDVTLYGFTASTYVRTCRMALMEKGVAYTLEQTMPQSEQQLALQPWGKVPAFRHGDLKLYETQAITNYIDEAFAGPALQPADAAGRALQNQWISVLTNYFYKPAIVDIVIQRIVVPSQGGTANEEQVAAAVEPAAKGLQIFDQALSESNYLAGDNPTLADYFLLPVINYLGFTPEGQKLLADAPNVSRWKEAMEARESAQEALKQN